MCRCRKSRQKRYTLFGLLAIFALAGVLQGLGFISDIDPALRDEAPTAFLLSVGLMIVEVAMLVRWCALDSRERGRRLGRMFTFGIILLAVVALPVYFLRTRGTRGFLSIFYALLLALAFIATNAIALAVTETLVEATR